MHATRLLVLIGRAMVPSILSFSAAISACGRAEEWQKVLRLLSMSEHLDQEPLLKTDKDLKKTTVNTKIIHGGIRRNQVCTIDSMMNDDDPCMNLSTA